MILALIRPPIYGSGSGGYLDVATCLSKAVCLVKREEFFVCRACES